MALLGVIHLDGLPVGVIRFQQPSGLPFLTKELDPVSPRQELPTGASDGARSTATAWRPPGGACEVMATLTTHRALSWSSCA